MMLHPGKVPMGGSSISAAFALTTVEVEFFGKPAHAASMPWQGINALDAAVQAYNGTAVLRQQLMPEDRYVGGMRDRADWREST
jgi:metal-dependent amidase/aminoacylase/carboxypeptidase family protein